ncbi:LuxR family transcriptional regulator [Intrasporangium oryzae NRRL B-24470]|uniref:LuxR family transcriptional regulator n=1 Tax=Intrasporangium oryzae NRRL B-24470 TaxID=1386089 RepID=W9GB81_9MICO|nr:helix-turn-helix transcriptional regulator [Intrasporangium oryzae]EWT02482.1 LuxR family transcriptional regulator [Intrasporangium oryzae NRRL B-24470]
MPLRSGALIGRGDDLARLSDATGLDERRGGVVVLSGDAGIGKTRLLSQLETDAADRGWLTAMGHCVGQAGSALAYLPFVELLGNLDSARPETVERVLATHPSLGHLLPGRRDAAQSQAAPGGPGSTAEPGQVAESVHALLSELGAEEPTLVMVEDVHWADHSSRDLLTLLMTRGFTTPVALVVTYRSDDLHRRHPLHETLAVWARIAGVEHIELAPLPPEAVRELVAGLEGAPTDVVTAGEIARRAEGNPFFAEELVASAAAGQMLTGGLSRVLRSRVEQLDETAQQVVRIIALSGRQIGHDLLARVSGLPDDVLDRAVAEAVEHYVIEACWPPSYTFRHALLGETVADMLLPGERLRLHRAYAAVLAERPDLAPASELARHSAAVGDLPTAVAASRAAAEAALAVGGPQDALQHLERALSWLDEDDTERDEVTLRASVAAMVAGEPVRAVDLLRDRLDHPGSKQRPEARADLLAALVVRARSIDLPIDPLALTREAVGLIDEDVAGEVRVRVLVAHLQALVDAGQFVEAALVGNEVALLAERLGMGGSLVEVRTIFARVVEAQEDLDSVERHLRSIVADLPVDDPLLLRAQHQLASIIHRRGDLPASFASYDAGAEVARRLHREWAPWGQESRLLAGMTAYELGDWDGAVRRLDLGGRPAPQPGRSLFTGALLSIRAGRGEEVDPAVFEEIREWWPVDGMCVVLSVMSGVDILGQAGDFEGLIELTNAATRALDRIWGEYHAVVRLAALVSGQTASAVAHVDAAMRDRLIALSDELTVRARRIGTVGPVVEGASKPMFERPPGEDLSETSRETWAWLSRVEAEALRLRWRSGSGEPPTTGEMVDAWQRSVAAFERYGHVFETARSQARLAAALHAHGDEAGSRAAADAAREVAERLGAKPLLAELATLRQSGSPGGGTGDSSLTPREVEVLALLARGLSNGQIGKQLYISTKTVSVHVSNLLAKLGAAGRTEAAAIARDRGLV